MLYYVCNEVQQNLRTRLGSRKTGLSTTPPVFRKLLSVYVFSYFPFGFEGRIGELIVLVPDYCLSFYFSMTRMMLALMLYFFIVAHKATCHTLSNAFLKSMKKL